MSELRDSTLPRGDVGLRPAAAVPRADAEAARRPWHGRMLEDASIELNAFRPGGRVFAIASAGCTAMALARRGDRVTAVDVHPGQVDLVRRRIAGEDVPEARTDRWLREGRRRLRDEGTWDLAALDRFLALVDVVEQRDRWATDLANSRMRALLRAALARPRLAGDRTGFPVGWTPDRFGALVERRLARTVATHPNRWNPYLWWLLSGRDAPGTRTSRAVPADGVTLHVAEACQWLEANPSSRFDGFTLSNLVDGASPSMRRRLVRAVRAVAEPDATVVLRTLEEPDDEFARWNASRDRSGIWGGVRVVPVRALEG